MYNLSLKVFVPIWLFGWTAIFGIIYLFPSQLLEQLAIIVEVAVGSSIAAIFTIMIYNEQKTKQSFMIKKRFVYLVQ